MLCLVCLSAFFYSFILLGIAVTDLARWNFVCILYYWFSRLYFTFFFFSNFFIFVIFRMFYFFYLATFFTFTLVVVAEFLCTLCNWFAWPINFLFFGGDFSNFYICFLGHFSTSSKINLIVMKFSRRLPFIHGLANCFGETFTVIIGQHSLKFPKNNFV